MLQDKIIIVTGGGGLLGKEICANIGSKGGVAINADICVQTSKKCQTLHLDVTSIESLEEGIAWVINSYGKIDGLVNNAYPRTKDWGDKFEDINADSWKANVDMQLNSIFIISQLVLKQMKLQASGCIINIGSIYGIVGNDFSLYEDYGGTSPAAYSAIKGGIINFTRYLASYVGPDNIRVNCVSPGGIKDAQPQSFIKKYESKVPLRRLGCPADIAPAVSFLLSDEAQYITGHNLVVDGGWTVI